MQINKKKIEYISKSTRTYSHFSKFAPKATQKTYSLFHPLRTRWNVSTFLSTGILNRPKAYPDFLASYLKELIITTSYYYINTHLRLSYDIKSFRACARQ